MTSGAMALVRRTSPALGYAALALPLSHSFLHTALKCPCAAQVVNFMEDPDYDSNSHPEYVTWQLWGCPAGRYDLGFVYSAATINRPMLVEVNGVSAATPTFNGQRRASGATGQSTVWAEQFVQVDLVEGQNTVTLAATGANIRLCSVKSTY